MTARQCRTVPHSAAQIPIGAGCDFVDGVNQNRQRGKSQESAALCGTAALPAADLDRLAHAVARLSPSHRDPERFHIDRSEIVAELRRLARVLGDDNSRGRNRSA